MKALVHTAPYEFDLREVPDPVPGPGKLLIRVRAVGICGSDVHGMTGRTGRRVPPVVMGHEASGVVEAVGTGAGPDWLGKRVTFDSTIYCGKCGSCKSGEINLCENRTVLGVSCDEYRKDGAFADLVAVPEHVVYELPDEVAFEHGAMIEPLSVALHAVRRVELRGDDRVLVVGCGIIGLLTIQAARATGCGTIIATDLSDRRLEAARDSGADIAIKPEKLRDQDEVDVAFEAVGAPRTVAAAIGQVRKGGAVVLIGNVAPEVPLPLQVVVSRQITVFGSCASAGEYPDCLEMVRTGKVNLSPLITETVPLERAAEMFGKLHDNPDAYLKVIVSPGGVDV